MMRVSAFMVLFGMASSASAEWDTETKAAARGQIDGAIAAEVAAVYVIRHGLEVPGERAEALFVGRNTMFGWEHHVRAVVALMDAGDVESPAFLAETRPETLARAAKELALAAQRYADAKTVLETMAQSTVLATVSSQLNLALDSATTFDRTLGWDEPRVAAQLAVPGAARFRSAAFGPHGWYEFAGSVVQSWAFDHRRTLGFIFDALQADPTLILFTNSGGKESGMAFAAARSLNVGKLVLNGLGLFAGVENGTDAAAIDIILGGFLTTRGRHFSRGVLVHEKMAAFTHQGREPSIDVNGRTKQRGVGYDFVVSGGTFSRVVRDSETPATDALLAAIISVLEEWGHTDDVADQVVAFKWAQPGGPNPPKIPGCIPSASVEDGFIKIECVEVAP